MALLHDAVPVLVLLLPAGIAWVVVLSTMNAALQLFLPAWVRGRGLSVYTIVLFGSQALGGIVFGALADLAGLVPALLAAAGATAVGAATVRVWPFLDTSGMDRGTVDYWPEPALAPDVDPADRPVGVMATYHVAAERQEAFVAAMARVRDSRLRTGAISWGLYRDGEDGQAFVEVFVVPSWSEHLRQHHERLTGTDRAYEEAAEALADGPAPARHFISVDVRASRRGG
jgi:uncharacterized protein YegL